MQQAIILEKVFYSEARMELKLKDWYLILLQCLERRKQRQQLLRLDDRMLKDIGISRADALKEARKPCWES